MPYKASLLKVVQKGDKTSPFIFFFIIMEKNQLINECLDYISELVTFLREEGYPITRSRLNELRDKYDALPY